MVKDEAVKLLLDNIVSLPPSLVVDRIADSNWHTYKYLDALLVSERFAFFSYLFG